MEGWGTNLLFFFVLEDFCSDFQREKKPLSETRLLIGSASGTNLNGKIIGLTDL